METNDMTQEQISALLDSELGEAHIEGILASLRRSEGRATWDMYHQIGDALRSEDVAHDFSAGFTARLFDRLEEEPPILAPPRQVEAQPAQLQQAAAGGARIKRFGFPVAIAAAAVFAIAVVPQLTKKQGDVVAGTEKVVLPAQPGGSNVVLTSAPVAPAVQAAPTTAADGAVLRDPRLDQYLMAHQGVSPSWNSSAEYARSATYTVTSDSNK